MFSKNKSLRHICFGWGLTLVIILTGQIQAQTMILEEITVTARKLEESLQDAPISVTALTRDDIRAASLEDISYIDRVTPNLWFQGGSRSGGTSNNAQVFIRGIGQFDFIPTADPGVGSYIDGIYLGRAVGGVFNLNDVERIEVLRGPQGTLFGRNTIGGAINVVTAQPTLDKREGFLELKAGNDDWLEGNGVVNLPLGDSVAARLSFNIKNRDGYGTSTVAPEIDWGNNDNYSLRAALRWQASDSFEATFNADYYRQDQASMPSNSSFFTGVGLPALRVGAVLFGILPGPPEFLPGGPPGSGVPVLPTPGTIFAEDSFVSSKTGPSKDDGEIWGVSLNMTWDAFEWGSIKSTTSYRNMDLHFIDDNDSYFIELALTDDEFEQWQFSQELQLSGEIGKLNWINGLYYFYEKVTELNAVMLMPGFVQALEAFPAAVFPVTPTSVCPGAFPANICAGGAGNPVNLALDNNTVDFNKVVVNNIAFYTQGSYQLSDQWSLTAGIRFTYEEKDFTRSQFKPDSSALL
ncbi:MAG: TonB-dependent receptor, partial [Gammaproteobacteria bacterium]|nr:TonB-dependent receptor [Gammaproteobacteria bacterium]